MLNTAPAIVGYKILRTLMHAISFHLMNKVSKMETLVYSRFIKTSCSFFLSISGWGAWNSPTNLLSVNLPYIFSIKAKTRVFHDLQYSFQAPFLPINHKKTLPVDFLVMCSKNERTTMNNMKIVCLVCASHKLKKLWRTSSVCIDSWGKTMIYGKILSQYS